MNASAKQSKEKAESVWASLFVWIGNVWKVVSIVGVILAAAAAVGAWMQASYEQQKTTNEKIALATTAIQANAAAIKEMGGKIDNLTGVTKDQAGDIRVIKSELGSNAHLTEVIDKLRDRVRDLELAKQND